MASLSVPSSVGWRSDLSEYHGSISMIGIRKFGKIRNVLSEYYTVRTALVGIK